VSRRSAHSSAPRSARRPLAAVLLATACLLAPLAVLAVWATHGIGDTARYAATTAPLATDTEVRDAIATAVTDDIMREIDVGPPLRDPVHTYVHDAVRSFTGTEAFRSAWGTANLAAHDAVLHALRDDGERTTPVTLDLAPATRRLKERLVDDHVPFAERIPVAHTRITLLPADRLTTFRKGFHVLELAGFWLPSATLVCAVAGIVVAVSRRRAVIAVGLGTALGAALLALAVLAGRLLTLSGLPDDVSQPAAGAVYDALTETLRTVSWILLTTGLAVAAAAWLTGRRTRRRQAPAAPSTPAAHVAPTAPVTPVAPAPVPAEPAEPAARTPASP
jgi:hypothetical protein